MSIKVGKDSPKVDSKTFTRVGSNEDYALARSFARNALAEQTALSSAERFDQINSIALSTIANPELMAELRAGKSADRSISA